MPGNGQARGRGRARSRPKLEKGPESANGGQPGSSTGGAASSGTAAAVVHSKRFVVVFKRVEEDKMKMLRASSELDRQESEKVVTNHEASALRSKPGICEKSSSRLDGTAVTSTRVKIHDPGRSGKDGMNGSARVRQPRSRVDCEGPAAPVTVKTRWARSRSPSCRDLMEGDKCVLEEELPKSQAKTDLFNKRGYVAFNDEVEFIEANLNLVPEDIWENRNQGALQKYREKRSAHKPVNMKGEI